MEAHKSQLINMTLVSGAKLRCRITIRFQIIKKKNLKTLWPLFMDGVQLRQGYSHFEETVYFLPFSSQKFLVLILSTS